MHHTCKQRLACSTSLLILAPLATAAALAVGVSSAAAQATLAAPMPTAATGGNEAVTATDTTTADATSTSTQVGEIMVTARLRQEDVLKVPETVVPISPDVLTQNNITNFYNLQGFAPSVDIYTNWIADYSTVEIRGFPAASYFNEIPTQPYALYDMGETQILYGPQGTLFGYTALGGAVLYTPVHPEMNHFGAGIDLTEGNLNETNIQGYVNIPLIPDRLAMRISAERDHTDGYIGIVGSSTKLDSNDNESIRLGIQYNSPGGHVTNYLMAQFIHQFDTETAEVPTLYNPLAEYYQAAYTSPAIFSPFFLCSSTQIAQFFVPGTTEQQCAAQHSAIFATFLQQTQQGIALARASGGREVLPPNENAAPLDGANDYQLDDIANFDVVSWGGALGGGDIQIHNIEKMEWYNNIVSNFTVGADDFYAASGTRDYIPTPNTTLITPCSGPTDFSCPAGAVVTNPANGLGAPNLGKLNIDYSDELQIHGTLDAALGATPGVTWVLGLYGSGGPNGTGPTSPNIPISFNGGYNVNEGPVPSYWPKSYWSAHWAEYFNATIDMGMFFKPLTGLEVSGGVRQSQNYTSDYYFSLKSSYDDPAHPNIFYPSTPISHTLSVNDPLNWSASLSYSTDTNNAYLSTAYIVVPGFANTPLPTSVTPAQAPGYVATAAAENLNDYEIGDKYRFNFNGVRGYVDLDAYHETLSNVQLGQTVFVPSIATYIGFTSNPANETKDGLEFQAEVFPTEHLDIYMNYSYAHDWYTKYLSSDPEGSFFQGTTNFVGTYTVGGPNSALCVPSASLATIPAANRNTPGTQGTCIMDFKSSPLPFAPDDQASLRVNYTIPVKDGSLGDLVAGLTVTYQSKEYMAGGYTNVPLLREEEALGPAAASVETAPARTLINMRLTWNHPMGVQNLTAALWVTNLTDVDFPTSALDFLFATGVMTNNYGPPRQFGFELNAKW